MAGLILYFVINGILTLNYHLFALLKCAKRNISKEQKNVGLPNKFNLITSVSNTDSESHPTDP